MGAVTLFYQQEREKRWMNFDATPGGRTPNLPLEGAGSLTHIIGSQVGRTSYIRAVSGGFLPGRPTNWCKARGIASGCLARQAPNALGLHGIATDAE